MASEIYKSQDEILIKVKLSLPLAAAELRDFFKKRAHKQSAFSD